MAHTRRRATTRPVCRSARPGYVRVERLCRIRGTGARPDLAWEPPVPRALRFQASHLGADETLVQDPGVAHESLRRRPGPSSTDDGEGRAASRWCGGEDAAIRCAFVGLVGLEGTSILYDEMRSYGSSRRSRSRTLISVTRPRVAREPDAQRQRDHGAGEEFLDGSTMVAGRWHCNGERRRPAERSASVSFSARVAPSQSVPSCQDERMRMMPTARRARARGAADGAGGHRRAGQPWSEQM